MKIFIRFVVLLVVLILFCINVNLQATSQEKCNSIELDAKAEALDEALKDYEAARKKYIEAACKTEIGEPIPGADEYINATTAMVKAELEYNYALFGPRIIDVRKKELALLGAREVLQKLEDALEEATPNEKPIAKKYVWIAKERVSVLDAQWLAAMELELIMKNNPGK